MLTSNHADTVPTPGRTGLAVTAQRCTEPWPGRSQPAWAQSRYFTPGCCCLLRRKYPGSLTEYALVAHYWSGTRAQLSERRKEHTPGRQPGRQEAQRVQETPFHSPLERGAAASALQPYPTEQTARQAVWSQHHRFPSVPWSPSSRQQAAVPPGETTRTTKLGSHWLETPAIDQQILSGRDLEVLTLTFGSP